MSKNRHKNKRPKNVKNRQGVYAILITIYVGAELIMTDKSMERKFDLRPRIILKPISDADEDQQALVSSETLGIYETKD